MSVEAANGIWGLNTAWPQNVDLIAEGDDHIRLIKIDLRATWPNVGAPITATHTEHNYLVGVTSGIQAQINAKANLAGPTVFTGPITLPATTDIGTVSATELAFLDGVTSGIQAQIAARGVVAGQVWGGTHDFTAGNILVPTLPAGTSGNRAASVDFVASAALSATLPAQAGNAGKFIQTDGTTPTWQFPTCPVTPFTGTAQTLTANTRHPMTNVAASAGTLPLAPPDGTFVGITPANSLLTNTVLRNGALIMGTADDLTIDAVSTVWLFYRAATNDWRI
jgi:hypothetical protein